MKPNELKLPTLRNLNLLARILCQQHGLDVRSGAFQTAATDGKTIYLPQDWAVGNEGDAIMLEGAICHEAAGHGRHTDFRARRSNAPVQAALENVFEDIRIELAAAEDYPGVPLAIGDMITEMVKRGMFGQPQANNPLQPGDVLVNALLARCRAAFLPGQETLWPSADAWVEQARKVFGPIWDKVWRVAGCAPNCTTTAQAIDLAAKVIQVLQSDLLPPDLPPPAQEQARPTDKSKPAKGSSAAAASDDALSQSASASQRQAGASAAAQQQCASKGDLGQLAGDALNASKTVQTPSARQLTQGFRARSSPGRFDDRSRELARELENGLARELEVLLEARVNTEISYGPSGRRLSSRRLPKLRLGNPNIFKRKREEERLNTAISLIYDTSGSMSASMSGTPTTRGQAAAGLALVLGRLLDRFEVPFEVAQFADGLATVKSFEESWREREQFAANAAGGGTNTSYSMNESLLPLCLRDEERKLMIVITDGEPADLLGVQACYHEAPRHGVEVATIFIGPSSPTVRWLRSEGRPVVCTDHSDMVLNTALKAIMDHL